MTKRTPLQERHAALEKLHAAWQKALEEFESKRLDAIERPVNDRDKIIRAETDPKLSPKERLEIFKGLQGWPRIVLGLYEAELKNVTADDGDGKPSDIAYEKVGNVVGLGPDRIKALCNEARRHLKEGMPAGFVVNMTAAEFERRILRRNRAARRKRTV
jgi:hypothetical protein